jgi:hypothetical protein
MPSSGGVVELTTSGETRMTNGIDERGVPLPQQPWQYCERLIEALAAAAQIHGDQARKGTTIPYLSHLLGTCAIALDYGANEDEAIAALLHDAIEDGQPTEAARATVWGFGEEVGRIVLLQRACGCLEIPQDWHFVKGDWLARKDSNLQSPDPESGALPLGHSPAMPLQAS